MVGGALLGLKRFKNELNSGGVWCCGGGGGSGVGRIEEVRLHKERICSFTYRLA